MDSLKYEKMKDMTEKIYNWDSVLLPFCTSINNGEIYTSQPVNNAVNLADFIGNGSKEKYPFFFSPLK